MSLECDSLWLVQANLYFGVHCGVILKIKDFPYLRHEGIAGGVDIWVHLFLALALSFVKYVGRLRDAGTYCIGSRNNLSRFRIFTIFCIFTYFTIFCIFTYFTIFCIFTYFTIFCIFTYFYYILYIYIFYYILYIYIFLLYFVYLHIFTIFCIFTYFYYILYIYVF
jgi:hypothetical protein